MGVAQHCGPKGPIPPYCLSGLNPIFGGIYDCLPYETMFETTIPCGKLMEIEVPSLGVPTNSMDILNFGLHFRGTIEAIFPDSLKKWSFSYFNQVNTAISTGKCTPSPLLQASAATPKPS
jgi:hypothetical protein